MSAAFGNVRGGGFWLKICHNQLEAYKRFFHEKPGEEKSLPGFFVKVLYLQV